MKTSSLLSLIVFSAGLVLASGNVYAASSAKMDDVEKARATGKPVLEKGMSADEILRLVGKPTEVIPMAAPSGKAERWTYRRVADRRVTQTSNTLQFIPAYVGFTKSGPTIAKVAVPAYQLKHVVTYQVTSLLMFEGSLVRGVQTFEQNESFTN